MIFSRFTHCYSVGQDVALYNSLRMRPVYMSYSDLQNLKSSLQDDNAQILLKNEHYKELCDNKIIVDNKDFDDYILSTIKKNLPAPSISVCYFILSEQCNLACKYCFVGNNIKSKREKFYKKAMTKEIANTAISFLVKQLKLNKYIGKTSIIFYGGEPLLNFETLVFVVNKINSLKSTENVLQDVDFSIVTNGLLLDEYKLKTLSNLNVSIAISIDGCNEETNKMRVDKNNRSVFPSIKRNLDLALSLNIPVSLSITLTEETIKDKDVVLSLIKKYNIKGCGFNILMTDNNFQLPITYNEKASDFLIEMFKELRNLGVYEDRIMRKLTAFTKAELYLSDCAATSGGQLVIAANGDVGICHGYMSDRKYFVTNVYDQSFNHKQNEVWTEWSHLSPIEKEECINCEALGICGGGCPLNASKEHQRNTIHSIDERFCIHAKKTLNFFICDLYRILTGEEVECKKILL